MHCREFRDKHVAFVDDLLPIVEMERMRRHLLTCPACARQDTRVRRGLMLVRNLRPIETSPEFMTRLNARIAEMGPVRRDDFVRPRASIGSMASFDRRGRVVVLAVAAQMLGLAIGPALGASLIQPGQYTSVNYIAMAMFGLSWVCILPPVLIQQQRARARELGWGMS